MRKVYIDLGHGGKDSGAINRSLNILEKSVVLEIGKLIETKLKNCNLDVKLSRYSDITKSLSERTTEANKWGADCLVSLHLNDATNNTAQGLETYCYKFKYRKLADNIHDELLKASLYTKNRGVKEGNLHMIRESSMSACLIELFFINNIDDVNKLLNKKDLFATAITKGICNYLNVEYKPIITPPTAQEHLWAVCVGAYNYNNAKAKQEELINKGYKDTYLIKR